MLCGSANKNVANFAASCITSYLNGNNYGEIKISYGLNNNINDYLGIGSTKYNPFGDGALQYIGVIRNYTGYNAIQPPPGILRCFTTALIPTVNCTAPASGFIFGAPYLINNLPVVSAAAELATENADGSPARGIPGAFITTPGPGDSASPPNYWNFGVNYYNPSNCSQQHALNTYSQGQISYVQQFNFGGTIGVQDAVVLDGFAIGPPNHIERYYYVAGYGRVRESKSYEAPGSSVYDNDGTAYQATNNYHNYLLPLDKTQFNSTLLTTTCGQGSAVPI